MDCHVAMQKDELREEEKESRNVGMLESVSLKLTSCYKITGRLCSCSPLT